MFDSAARWRAFIHDGLPDFQLSIGGQCDIETASRKGHHHRLETTWVTGVMGLWKMDENGGYWIIPKSLQIQNLELERSAAKFQVRKPWFF